MPGNSKSGDHQSYFGSVRFFKHIMITIFILIVTVPTIFAIVLGIQNNALRENAGKTLASATAPVTAEDDIPELKVEVPPWQSLYPELYAQEADRSTLDQEKTVYLTFDDGPSVQTPKLLEILAQYDVKATFFVVGHTDAQSKARMKAIVDAGNAIGVHSFTHNYKTIYASATAYLADFEQEYNLIYEATGIYPQIFRFPGGSINGYNGVTYQEIISEMVRRGFVYFDWNVATGDAVSGSAQDADILARNALQDVKDLRRAVVLMHDSGDKSATVEALPAIIEGYQAAGFTFEILTPEVVPVVYAYPDWD